MAMRDVTDPQAVQAALREFDELGREEFLDKYGFKPAREYFLIHEGKPYDSKAIVGAAHRFQHGTALTWRDFSGGTSPSSAVRLLEKLGFEVVSLPQ